MNTRYVTAIMTSLFLFAGCNSDDDTIQEPLENLTLATVSVYPVANIFGDAASSGGDILDNGGSTIQIKGVCWSTEPAPTVNDFKKGSGPGDSEFISSITGLNFNTTYYLRAYAVNETGVAYSDEIVFTTNNECSKDIIDRITLRSQAAVDSFGEQEVCGVVNELEIDGAEGAITSLEPLYGLKSIGELWISNTNLTSLTGLETVSNIKRSVNIQGNQLLTNIDALQGVISDVNSIRIIKNSQLTSIDGLLGISNLVVVDEQSPSIFIIGNSGLEHLNGLGNITTSNSDVEIAVQACNSIIDLNGLSGFMGTIGSLNLTEMPNLVDIDGLQAVDSVFKDIIVQNCNALTSLSGMQQITTIGGSLSFYDNSSLLDLDDFLALYAVGGDININGNTILDYCGLLPLLEEGEFAGTLRISNNSYNPSLQDILNGNCRL